MKLSKINPEFELKTNDYKSKTYEIQHIIIDCSCMNYIDSMGMNTILNVS